MKVSHFPKNSFRTNAVKEHIRLMRLLYGHDRVKVVTKDNIKDNGGGLKRYFFCLDETSGINKKEWIELGKMMLPTGDKYETKQ